MVWETITHISESAANAAKIHVCGKTVVVENPDKEIIVYDAMGHLVYRDMTRNVITEIKINNAGVYIVKVGSKTERIMIKP